MKSVIIALSVVLISGCSTLPDVSFTYNKTKWATTVTVSQTLSCNVPKDKIIVLSQSTVTTSYSANQEQKLEFPIKELDKWYSDVDAGMTLTDDGRLKGINQSSNGQGEAILKSAVTSLALLGAALEGEFSLANTPLKPISDVTAKCAEIEKWGGGKPITLVFRKMLTAENASNGIKASEIDPASESRSLYDLINTPKPKIAVTTIAKANHGIKNTEGKNNDKDFVQIKLQEPGVISISITDGINADSIGGADVRVPLNSTYSVPIPKGKFFGKQTFVLAMSEAGTVTAVTYGKTSVGAAGLNSFGALASTQTPTSEAAELKAQADVIAQQQRLASCLSKPDQCK